MYTWYVGGGDSKTEIIYTNFTSNPTYNISGGDNLGQVKRSGTTLTRFYYLKDHLRDIRMTVNSSGGVDSYCDYYPFGQIMDGRSLVGSADGRYKFTGKEKDAETGYDYFGARYFDSRVGRFLSVDPHALKYQALSPFCYAANNPVAFLDPTGMDSASSQANVGALVATGIGTAVRIVLPNLIEPVVTATSAVVGLLTWMATNLPSDAPPDAVRAWQAKAAQPDQTSQDNTSNPEKPSYPVPELDENGHPKGDEWTPPTSPDANYTKPKPSKEYLRPDPNHPQPIGPHSDWRDPSGKTWRIFKDGRVLPK